MNTDTKLAGQKSTPRLSAPLDTASAMAIRAAARLSRLPSMFAVRRGSALARGLSELLAMGWPMRLHFAPDLIHVLLRRAG